jgi:hypothetical protein
VKSEPSPSYNASTLYATPAVTKTVPSKIALDPKDAVSFDTEIDALMKAIQSKSQASTKTGIDVFSERKSDVSTTPGIQQEPGYQQAKGVKPLGRKRSKYKIYSCNVAGCNKTFTQKTHMDVHTRSHTGDKPYVGIEPRRCLSFH